MPRGIYRPRRIPVAINATDFHLLAVVACGCCCNDDESEGKGRHGIKL
jgi:hypothetical protein